MKIKDGTIFMVVSDAEVVTKSGDELNLRGHLVQAWENNGHTTYRFKDPESYKCVGGVLIGDWMVRAIDKKNPVKSLRSAYTKSVPLPTRLNPFSKIDVPLVQLMSEYNRYAK